MNARAFEAIHAREHSEGARSVPFARLAKARFAAGAEKIGIFLCRTGARTAYAVG